VIAAKILTAALGLLLLVTAAPAAAPRPVYQEPKDYYLALGDSLAYGMQPDKASAGLPPARYDSGYVDVFAARLRTLAPKLQVVNYGCPGESTATFTKGGCLWLTGGRRLHDAFRGSQLRAALAFLHAHPGQVSPITVTLGGNDAQAFSDACQGSIACARKRAPQALAALASRLSTILGKLRAAAPTAEIIVTGMWSNDLTGRAETEPLYRSVNATMARAAAGARARFADLLPTFDPPGTVAAARARICAYTFMCSQNDGHPTDAGYRAIAAALLAASGYPNRPG
jgi:lysophospholipase L1-like esterase